MKTIIAASLIAITTAAAAAPALAQAPAAAPAPAATATASASGAISVDKTTVADIIKNPKAKAALEAALPPISQYYDQIGGMTLAQVAPMSQGALDDAKLKALQVKFDEINAGK
ncbi:hypothetical protein [Phenylobacterium sp.]|uniref:hypothetical protein n=1 Tax=Phenylobacterium sp. TaxID=1871053 RepID=UPI002DE2C565|nr:hypothetical protein [Phenylobacterium sp.]